MIRVIQDDITKVTGFDAIVNPANNSLLGGGGLDGMIHRAAGPQLKTECRKLNGCETGDSRLTLGYNLPCKYIIHSVGPVWMGGMAGEENLLSSCYLSALKIAADKGIRKIAFPSISTGEYGYPLDQASKIAVTTISSFVTQNPDRFDDICFVVSDKLSYDALLAVIKEAEPKKAPAKKKVSAASQESDENSDESEKKSTRKKSKSIPELPKPEAAPAFADAPYNKYHIDWLIDEIANGNPHTYVCFWLAEKNNEYCQLSQWYKGEPIFINGRSYHTAEQYMMSEKALLFGDIEAYAKIMNEEDPAICKKLGRQVKNFDETVWKNCNREIIFNANFGKFLSDRDFAKVLMSTGDSVIIEASPKDDIYGAGLAKEDLISDSGSLIIPPQNWHLEGSDFQAKNELGFVLMAVRDYFKNNH